MSIVKYNIWIFNHNLFVLNSKNYHKRKSVILDRTRRGNNVYLRLQINPFISNVRRESCVLSRKWHLSILCFVTPGSDRELPGQSRWLSAPLRPGHSRHPALLWTRDGLSLSLSDMRQTSHSAAPSSVRARLPGERGRLGVPRRAAPAREWSNEFSIQKSVATCPRSSRCILGQKTWRVIFVVSDVCLKRDNLWCFLHKMILPEVLPECVEQERNSVNLLGCDLKVQV